MFTYIGALYNIQIVKFNLYVRFLLTLFVSVVLTEIGENKKYE